MRKELQIEEKQGRRRHDHPGPAGLEHPTVEPPGARGHPSAQAMAVKRRAALYAPWRPAS